MSVSGASDEPAERVIRTGDGFWNIRGSFKLGGIVDLGTQASLVRRANGRFVLLDACPLTDDARRWVMGLTDGGAAVEAILHVHPFHTLHVRRAHELFPEAKLYGTARHVRMFEELPWEGPRTDDPALHELFAGDLEFSVPRGVDFIPSNENLHFSSVLVLHRASRTLHVDDTLLYVRMPKPVRALKRDVLRLHPTLPKVLERRAGAAEDFRGWARELVEWARDVDNLCAAHSDSLLGRDNAGESVSARIEAALGKVEGTLRAHERAHG